MYKKFKITGTLLILLISFSFVTSFSPKSTPFALKVIVIDAGHGGKDPGCHGKKHNEKDIALSVALKLGKYIEENITGVKVVYTRKTDVFVELQERAAIANKANADLFISIHCNSACFRDKSTKKDVCRDHVDGAETFVMAIKNEKGNLSVATRENAAMLLEDNYVEKVKNFDPNSDEAVIIQSVFNDRYLVHSLKFASKIQYQYASKIGRTDRGVKRASLWVLWRTSMPSVLTEIGYLTNPSEESFLGSDKGQDYIASGLFRAFREYKDELEGISKKYNDAFEKQEPYKKEEGDTLNVKVEEQIKEEPKEVKKNDEKINTSAQIIVPKVKDSVAIEENQPSKVIDVVVYKVQIFVSSNVLDSNSEELKKVEKPGVYIENGIYKYTSGEFSSLEKAAEHKNFLKANGYKDAFVVAIKNGQRIPLR